MESRAQRRVPIVANRTAATPDLLEAVKRYAREDVVREVLSEGERSGLPPTGMGGV